MRLRDFWDKGELRTRFGPNQRRAIPLAVRLVVVVGALVAFVAAVFDMSVSSSSPVMTAQSPATPLPAPTLDYDMAPPRQTARADAPEDERWPSAYWRLAEIRRLGLHGDLADLPRILRLTADGTYRAEAHGALAIARLAGRSPADSRQSLAAAVAGLAARTGREGSADDQRLAQACTRYAAWRVQQSLTSCDRSTMDSLLRELGVTPDDIRRHRTESLSPCTCAPMTREADRLLAELAAPFARDGMLADSATTTLVELGMVGMNDSRSEAAGRMALARLPNDKARAELAAWHLSQVVPDCPFIDVMAQELADQHCGAHREELIRLLAAEPQYDRARRDGLQAKSARRRALERIAAGDGHAAWRDALSRRDEGFAIRPKCLAGATLAAHRAAFIGDVL